MAYATTADMVARYGYEELVQLTDRAGANAIDSAAVSNALADASAVVDGYLARRYHVPVASTQPLLLRLTCDLARHTLHGKATTESVRAANDAALKVLQDLSNGIAALPGAVAALPADLPAASTGRVVVAAPDRVFGATGSSGYDA